MKEYNSISMFSGAMGLDLGLEKAGIEFKLAVDNYRYACETIRENKPGLNLLEGDLENYTSDDILSAAGIKRVFLICGGPPCQAFSSAGKRKGFNDERGNVFLHYIKLICEIRPKYYLIENVRGLLSAPLNHIPHKYRTNGYRASKGEVRGGAILKIISMLKDAGYSVSFTLYDAANYGVPQRRERVIILGSRDGVEIPLIPPTHSETGLDGKKKWLDFHTATKGLKGATYVPFPEKRLEYYRMLGPGQNWRDLPIELQKEAMGNSFYAGGGKTGFLRRLAWDKPSPTLVTCPTMPATDLAHPEENRPLSVEEYKRIQQFPDDWQLCGSIQDKYKLIGNAVPIGLGYAAGKHLLWFDSLTKVQKEKALYTCDMNTYSRYKNTDHNYYMRLLDIENQMSIL